MSKNATETIKIPFSVVTDSLFRRPCIGSMSPVDLPELRDFLTESTGEISYEFAGKILKDQSARQKRHVKCIISGWFMIEDSLTSAPIRFDLNIESTLVLVSSEIELPPLEDETDDEDTIVCGNMFDLASVVQEEILLTLPVDTPRKLSDDAQKAHATELHKLSRELISSKVNSSRVAKSGADHDKSPTSPFAKLAALKKSG